MPAFPVQIRLARSGEEFASALQLLQASRAEQGLPCAEEGKLWVLKQHALPSTNTIIALAGPRVIGAICLFGDSPFQLPIEERLLLKSFRRNLDGRLAELSLPATDPEAEDAAAVRLALFHFALCFGASYCHYDALLIEAPSAWAREEGARLQLKPLFEPIEGRQLLHLPTRGEAPDFKSRLPAGFPASFVFPEKKFFLVAHQSMSPEVFGSLFNEKSRLFAALSDQDLRVLKNIYDWGDYARHLPDRKLDLPERKTPRHPRFPMNCEGFLVNEDGEKEHVLVLDVSREGLKIRHSHALDPKSPYVFTVFIGVNRKSELIAHVIWCDRKAEISGLEVRSADAGWQELLSYLEKDYLRVA